MHPTPTCQPDGMSAGQTTTTAMDATSTDHFAGMVMNRIGADDHDDGLVHGHLWAAGE